MDGTLFEIIIDEFDANCSLIDALQDAFLENTPFSFLGLNGSYCNATTDQIGTCWPRSGAGELVERPCPEYFNGIRYNTTSVGTESLKM